MFAQDPSLMHIPMTSWCRVLVTEAQKGMKKIQLWVSGSEVNDTADRFIHPLGQGGTWGWVV